MLAPAAAIARPRPSSGNQIELAVGIVDQPAPGIETREDDVVPASTGPGDRATVQDASDNRPAPQQAGLRIIGPHVLPKRGRHLQGRQGSPVSLRRRGVADLAHDGQVVGVVRNPRHAQVGQGHGNGGGLALAPPFGPVARIKLREKRNLEVNSRQWGHDQRD